MASREELMREAQQRATRAISEAIAPLVDGKVVIGVEVVVLLEIEGHTAPSRCNMGHTPAAKTAVRQAAMQLHLGLRGEPVGREDQTYLRPKRH